MEPIKTNTHITYNISVITSAKKEGIAHLEKIADNLIVSIIKKNSFRLYITTERFKTGQFNYPEIQIPFSSDTFNHIKEMANHSRAQVLSLILKT